MPSCKACNWGTSTADLVAAIISRWAYAPEQQESDDHAILVRRLKKQAPDIVAEMTALNFIERKQARRHLEQHGVFAPNNSIVVLGGKTICQLNLFAHKMALGLFFEHFRVPLSNNGRCWATWRTKEDIQTGSLPREVISMMSNHDFLKQGTWNTQSEFEYRYSQSEQGLFGFSARLRKCLIIVGFAVSDFTTMDEEKAEEWLTPSDLLSVQDKEQYQIPI